MYVGKPATDSTHVDYIPTMFSFTTEEQKAALRSVSKNMIDHCSEEEKT